MVKVWIETVVIPTYEVGAPEKNPMFLERRVYQGSSGVVYPYPVIEKIADEKHDKEYCACYLENEYIKVMILPELGGRVQMAYDKIRQRHFVYYNHVVKPALVGLTGPWISGGIEFNWPQHHRPSTFLPVDYSIRENADGSATVWINEVERMFHQKGMAGFTLRPGRAVLEIEGRLSNPTPFPQTFLWWANPAVAVNEHYQSVFPSDVNAVFDHGKRAVSSFPVATGTYYKVDYSPGTDISRYSNIPVPTSYMAIVSDYDFVGGYENDTQAGLLHVADHHISPGKKQWTWGNGDFGQAWDRNLTDNDGPYIELMTGVYTDNQPDFTWLHPYEQKTFRQYFMPYRELGVVKNANADLLLNIYPDKEGLRLKVFATSQIEQVCIEVCQGERSLFREQTNLSPEQVYDRVLPAAEDFSRIRVRLADAAGRELIGWQADGELSEQIPAPAQAAALPADVGSVEQLFLTGQHLEQYRHATYDPMEYYLEGIQREPTDIRCNNAAGLLLMRRGQFAQAEAHLRTAVRTQTLRNPNPYDGEPLYNLGLCLKLQGKLQEAYKQFYKACWNAAWQDAGYFALAQISVAEGRYEDALEQVGKSLVRNAHHHRARALEAAILRKINRPADTSSAEALAIDGFNYGVLFENYLLEPSTERLRELTTLMRDDNHNYIELALDYTNAGLYDQAAELLDISLRVTRTVSPLVYYIQGFAHLRASRTQKALSAFATARAADPAYCFPNRLELIEVLEAAIEAVPHDAKAPYYLGNLFYDKRIYGRAIELWETSVRIDPQFPTAWRNLALAYFNKLNQSHRALVALETAFVLDRSDARILMELDQLYKRLNRPHKERLDLLERYPTLVESRDDLMLEYITLLNQSGEHERALERLEGRVFHPWEGGEGKVPEQYQITHLELAKQRITEGDYKKAEKLLEKCYLYPVNLGEGKLAGALQNDFDYYMGLTRRLSGDEAAAADYFERAASGQSEPAAAIYYNDQKPDKILYRGLACKALGRQAEARAWFDKLIAYGQEHLDDQIRIEYFAVSLPDLLIWEDDLGVRNQVHCLYLIGLGMLGRNQTEQARKLFEQALALNCNHQGAQNHLKLIQP